MSLNFTQMVAKASEYLQDPANARWGTTTLGNYVNDGQRDLARGSKIIKKGDQVLVTDAGLSPANAFYSLPSDILEIEDVWCSGIRLTPTSKDALPWNWSTITGQPTRYLYGQYGLADLRVYPYPTTAMTVTLDYTALPSDIAGTQTTAIPAIYHNALVWYAVAQAFMLDGQFRDPAKGQLFMDMYRRELADATDRAARRFNSDAVYIPYRHE